jgi:hypothetical protein
MATFLLVAAATAATVRSVPGDGAYTECKAGTGATVLNPPPAGTDLYNYLNEAAKTSTEIQLTLPAGDYSMTCDFDTRLSALAGFRFLSIVGAGADRTKITSGVCLKKCFDGYQPNCDPDKHPAPANRRLFTVGNGTCLHLQGLALSGGEANGYRTPAGGLASDNNWGGGILAHAFASADVRDVDITKCRANDGGAIYIRPTANVSLQRMHISENTATGDAGGGDGGGIATFNLAIIGMQDMAFENNVAKQGGGGLQLQLALVTLAKNMTFLHNQATIGGGSQIVPRNDLNTDAGCVQGHCTSWIFNGYPPASVAQFYQLAAAKGFAQYPALPTVCELCNFTENTATEVAGGLQVFSNPPSNSSTMVLSKLVADGNIAPRAGGVKFASGSSASIVTFNKDFIVRLEDSVVQRNIASEGSAGGMCLTSGNYSIARTKILSNTCKASMTRPAQGAGLYITGSPYILGVSTAVQVSNSTIADNKALGRNSLGGGVSVDMPAIGAPTNLQIKSCPRPIAAGITAPGCNGNQPWAVDYGCKCSLIENAFRKWSYSIVARFENLDVVSNEANYGGGFHVQNSNISFHGGRISTNTGYQGGAGFYLPKGSTAVALSDVLIEGNMGNSPSNIGLQLRSEAAGALSITGKSKIHLAGNQSEFNVALGGGEIRFGPLTKIQCPVGYAFTTDTRLGAPIAQTFGSEWSVNCHDERCIEDCQTFTDYRPCKAVDDAACWKKLPPPGNYTYLKCLRKCHASACSQCTDDPGCSTSFRNLTVLPTVGEYGYAFFSPCATCENSHSLQAAMLTQSLAVGCVPCTSTMYSLEGAYMVGAADAGLNATAVKEHQLQCDSCPQNGGNCEGGGNIVSKPDFYGVVIGGARDHRNIQFMRCPPGYCSTEKVQLDLRPGHQDVEWDFALFDKQLRNHTRRCPLRSNRDPDVYLCGNCKKGYGQSISSTNCVENHKCVYLWPMGALMLLYCLALVMYCLASATRKAAANVQIVIYYFQLFPFFMSKGTLDATTSRTEAAIVSVVHGVAALDMFTTSQSAGSHSLDICLQPNFSTINKLTLLYLPPICTFLTLIAIGKRLAPWTLKFKDATDKMLSETARGIMTNFAHGRTNSDVDGMRESLLDPEGSAEEGQAVDEERVRQEQLAKLKVTRTDATEGMRVDDELAFLTPTTGTSAVVDFNASGDSTSSVTKILYQPSKSTADEAYHCAFAKVWLLSFTTLCKASTTFMWCVDINGRSYLYYAANNRCGLWQGPAIAFFLLLLVPPMFVLFFAFLERQSQVSPHFFELRLVRLLRLKRLQLGVEAKLCSWPLLRAFFAPDNVYRKGYWWWSHAYALFRAIVVLDFVYGNGNVESSSMLIVIAMVWGAMQLAYWPYLDWAANQLQTLVVACLCSAAVFSYPISGNFSDVLTTGQSNFLKNAVIIVLFLPIVLPIFFLVIVYGLRKLGVVAVPLGISAVLLSDLAPATTATS